MICDDSLTLEDRRSMDEFRMPPGVRYDVVERHFQAYWPALNASQYKAVMATFQHRVVLIQGPPGTGKTTTSAAVTSMQRCVNRGGCLVCTSANVAADTIAAVLKEKYEPFWRFGSEVSKEYVTTLLENCPELKTIKEMEAKGGCRRRDCKKKSWKNNIKYAIMEAYSDEKSTAVGTLGSVSSHKASMNERTYSFLLLDEAAQSTEAETICALARMDLHAGVCFAGEYQQLPPFS